MATPDGSGAFTAEDLARRAKSLRALARSLVRDDGAAEDLVQDTMVVALERPPRSSASLPGWLATVARRLALDRARGERRRIAREERAARDETTESPVRALESLELERQVLDAVLALREPYRTVVYLRYWEELHPAAIAERLGVPVKTVKSRLARALEELRARLDSSVAGGRERWMAGLAGGAWIVKKAVVAVVAAALLVVLAWRATRGAEEPELPPAAASAAIEAGASARPAVEPAGDLPERTAAAAAPRADAATRATGELLVKLLRHDGTPAVDVSMDFRCAGDPTPREEFLRRRTDREGLVHFLELPAGDVIVDVDRGPRFEVQAVAGERREVELRLPEGLAVVGRVVGPGGEPVSGAEIWVEGIRLQWPRAHLVERTAADGSFRIEGLDDEAEIGARARGFVPSPTFETSTLPLGPSGAREIALELGAGGGEVQGRVTDPGGRPVAGALVKVGARGGGILDLPSGLRATIAEPVPVETDAEGRFAYAGDLEAGVQPVAVSARGRPNWTGRVEVRAGARADVEVVLAEPASLEGRVVDASRAPVAGAYVAASVEHMGGWYFDPFPPPRATTDAEGRFLLGWVAPGQQELNAKVPLRPELGKAKLTVHCAAGETAQAELVLETGLTITGRVVDGEGRPLVRWRVDADPVPYGNAYPRQGKTDELGRFLIANLDADHRYHLRVDAPETFSLRPRAERADVLPGARDVELVVEDVRVPDARFRGRLVGADGRPPADLQLVYYPEGGDRGGYLEFDAQTGAFESDPVLAGRYELRVYRGGQTVHRTEVFQLRAGETRDVGELRPGSLGRLELVLKGVPEKDLARLRPLMNRDGHGTEELTLDHGVFRSRTVTPGAWKIELHGPWFLRASEVEVRPDESRRVELAVERGYEVRIACRFADPAAPWTTLSSRVRDEKGGIVELGNTWFRAAMDDGHVELHGLSLPAGRMLVEASTDSGLAGSLWIEAGPGAGAQGELEILMQ